MPMLAFILVILFSCKKTTDPIPNAPPPTPITPVVPPKPVYSKTITKFVFRQSDNHFIYATDSLATIGADSITINMPGGTDLSKLIPTIEIAGKSVLPASGTAQDFTNPVTYTVTDSAGATKNYIVKINLSGAGEIIISAGSLYAYDAITAQLRWTSPNYINVNYSAVASDGKLVFSYGGMGTVYAQDIVTGKLVWSKDMAGSIRTPAISKGILYLPGEGQNMTALDAATGNQIWSKFFYLDNRFQAMNITNDIIYFVAQQDNRVYSVNALNGNLNWQSDPSLVFVATPTVSGNTVYASAYDSNMYALDKTTGHVTWSTHLAFLNSAPVISNGVLYVVGCNDSLYTLDATTGKKKWAVAGSSSVWTANTLTSSAMVSNGMVFVNSNDRYLYAFDANTGALRWSTFLNQNGLELVYIDGVVYTSSFAIKASDGSVIWSGLYTNPQNPRFTIIGKDGTVYNPVN